MPNILVIGATDSSAGAGLTADLETIFRLGGKCFPVFTAVTVQGPGQHFNSQVIPASVIKEQFDSILNQKIDAIKVGMLPNKESIEAVAQFFERINCPRIILDPVIKSSSGASLLREQDLGYLKEVLFPLVSLVTPNLFEANRLTGKNYSSTSDFPDLAHGFISFGTKAVLIKGGHSKSILCTDFFLDSGGSESFFEHQRISNGTQVRGTGCRLASSISYYLGDGQTMVSAVKSGIDYLQNYIAEQVE